MWTLFRNGGFPMFFIVGFGLVALGAAARYAIAGKRHPLGFILGMMGATLFATLSGTTADVGAVFYAVGEKWSANGPYSRTDIVFEGLAEVMSAGIFGFTLLALASLLIAVGQYRIAKSES